jgi:hypothetical protein
MSERFFGKYRGLVVNNADPENMGRIQVQVPAIGEGAMSGWALPCVPVKLPKELGSALPAIGAGVWIEFEGGDVNSPIWSGCFFIRPAETPLALRSPR